ncbi:hypothetical protein SV7mr_17310 [Stieleria bergensis]|uniref:ACR n=1 Tax=Stieleria bergensis TaxID=2528025 RepID=A0A517SSW2_9BACT|nr:hypothetical protein SV7mr_17310 [Planctomycetes bacterium SV_7m_r]
MRIIDQETGQTLVADANLASNPWQRFVGLMLRKQFPPGFALWIKPCTSIHTLWMRVTIDVYFIAIDGTVLESRKRVKPWRVAIPSQRTASVIEIVDPAIELPIGAKVELQP